MTLADEHCDRAVELAQAGDLDGARVAARQALGAQLGFARALELIDVLDAMAAQRGEGGGTNEWRPGTIIDQRFEVRGLLGRGGMGAVYRVHHREWGIDLAVKTPLPGMLADPVARARFLREAHCWIDLGVHPHVVQCWFVREIEGLPRLFLELVEGGTVDELAGRGQFREPLAIVDALIQVCDGLEHVHAQQIVHRDLKPSNLLVGEAGRIQLTDLGIARAHGSVDARGGGSGGLGTSGSLLGTPSYGAPEQWRDAAAVDGRADLYALGVVAFELCAGRRPFDTGHDDARELIARHLREPPPPLAPLAPHVPRSLVEIVERLLAKDPGGRFATARATRSALASVHEELGTPARPRPEIQNARGATLNNRGISRWDLGDRAGARAAWSEAIAHDPRQAEALYNAATSAWRAGEIDDLEAASRVSAAGDEPRGLLARGYLALERGAYTEAEALLARAVADPDVARESLAWQALGDARLGRGESARAIEAYERASADPARIAAVRAGDRPIRELVATPFQITKPWGVHAGCELFGASRVKTWIAQKTGHDATAARTVVHEIGRDGVAREIWAMDTPACWGSPDGSTIAALDRERLYVTGLDSGWRFHAEGKVSVAAWLDARRLVAVDPAGRVSVVDVTNGHTAQPWHLGATVTSVVASGERVVFATAREVVTCTIAGDAARIVARVPMAGVKLERITGERAIGRTESSFVIVDLAAGWVHEIRLSKTMYGGPQIGAAGAIAVVGLHGNGVSSVLVDLRTGRAVGMLDRHSSGMFHAAISPTESRIALQWSDSYDSATPIEIWNVANRRVERTLVEAKGRTLQFWPDDDHVLSCNAELALHELATGKRTQLAVARGALVVAGDRGLVFDARHDRTTIEVVDLKLGTVPAWRTLLASRGATVLQQATRSRDAASQIEVGARAAAQGDAARALAAIDAVRRVPGHERDEGALALQAAVGRTVPATRLRDAWPVRALPFRVSRVVMTPDGSLLAGVCSEPGPSSSELVVTTLDGREVRRIRGPTYSIGLSPDGRFVAGMQGDLVIWELATGREVFRRGRKAERDVEQGELFERLQRGEFDGDRFVEHAPPSWGPCAGERVYPCTERYFVEAREHLTMKDFVLWDRERQRTVVRRTLPDRSRMATVTVGGRFLLMAHARELFVFDLATGELHRTIDTHYFDYDIDVHATVEGRHVVLASIDQCWLFELDWELDPAGAPDPLAHAWNDVSRPPASAHLHALVMKEATYELEHIGMATLAKHHPDVEIVYARKLPPPQALEWTRRALQDAVVARDPEAWLQLGRLAIDAGDHALAADAAAEGLARAGDHAALQSLLERARQHAELQEIVPRRTFAVKASRVRGLVVDGEDLLLCDERRVCVLDLVRGTATPILEASGNGLAVHADWIAAGTDGGDVVVWDRVTRKKRATLETPGWMSYGDRNQMAFGLAFGGGSWEDIVLPKQPVRAVAFAGHTLLCCGNDQTLHRWDAVTGNKLGSVEIEHDLWQIVVRPDDVLVTGAGGLFRVTPDNKFESLDSSATAVAWTPQTGIVVGTSRGLLRWEDGTERDDHTQKITQLVVTGRTVASASADGLHLWRDRTRVGGVPQVPCGLAAIGDAIVTCDEDGTIAVW